MVKVSEVQKCKSPEENSHMVSSLKSAFRLLLLCEILSKMDLHSKSLYTYKLIELEMKAVKVSICQ